MKVFVVEPGSKGEAATMFTVTEVLQPEDKRIGRQFFRQISTPSDANSPRILCQFTGVSK
jgi:hypothetical protein